MRKIPLICCLLLLQFACSNPQKLIQDPVRTKIYFGHTGGVTNVELKFLLLDNGVLFKFGPEGAVRTGRVPKAKLKHIQEHIQKAGIEKIDLDKPGNLTYYIRVEKAGSSHEVKWSDDSGNEDLNALYTSLTDLLNQ